MQIAVRRLELIKAVPVSSDLSTNETSNSHRWSLINVHRV